MNQDSYIAYYEVLSFTYIEFAGKHYMLYFQIIFSRGIIMWYCNTLLDCIHQVLQGIVLYVHLSYFVSQSAFNMFSCTAQYQAVHSFFKLTCSV